MSAVSHRFQGDQELPGCATIFGSRHVPRKPESGDEVIVKGEIRSIDKIVREVVPCPKAPEGAWVVAYSDRSIAEMREAGNPIPDFEHHCKPDETRGLADPEDDPVDHPAHYQLPGGIEVIQITRHLNFNLGNAVKYLLRAGRKGDAVEDLRKALWYIQDEIKLEQDTDIPF